MFPRKSITARPLVYCPMRMVMLNGPISQSGGFGQGIHYTVLRGSSGLAALYASTQHFQCECIAPRHVDMPGHYTFAPPEDIPKGELSSLNFSLNIELSS